MSWFDERRVQFTAPSLSYAYVNPYTLSGCSAEATAHWVTVDMQDRTGPVASSGARLLEFGDFDITEYIELLRSQVIAPAEFVGLCDRLDTPNWRSTCQAAAARSDWWDSGMPTRMAGALLGVGGLEALFDLADIDQYEDPIPPAPEGHVLVDGYDLDEMSAQVEQVGGYAALILLANTVPGPNSNGGSTNDLAEEVMTAEAARVPMRDFLAQLASTIGVNTLGAMIYTSVHQGSEQPTTGETPVGPPVPHPAPGDHGNGNPGGKTVIQIDPGAVTVNEVLRVWYQRIDDGRMGPSTAVADPEQINENVLRAAATQCLRLAAAATRVGASFASSNPCRDERVLVPAGSALPGNAAIPLNAYEAALHDLDAIVAHPTWLELNYMGSAAKQVQVPRRWFERAPYFAVSGCKQAPDTAECDEYPLYATTQGGPVEMGGSGASLRPALAGHNRNGGIVFGAMVNTAKCEMESAPPVPSGQPASGGTAFLVVPMPGIPAPSFYLC